MAQATPSPIPDHPPQDTPIEIYGYVTDPKLVGYQILTNYESTYWRALVGKDVWSLYEVLRSFCHEGNNTCNPSLKTLMAILGLTDRRQLIGRVDTKPGKEREIPGLIDTLQDYKLAYAEIKGEGPKLRYIFHVNLHPPALTQEQLKELPKPLQRKHDDLLQRVTKSAQKLDKIEQTKSIEARKTLASVDEQEGGGTVPPPLVQYHPPPGTVPPKQHPYNNTHVTTKKKKKNNNNNSGVTKQDVVVALTGRGMTKKVAQRLASRYKEARILQKVDYYEYLTATDPDKIKSPAGYLRRAIEDDYAAPSGYTQDWQEQIKAEAEAKQVAQAQQKAVEERLRAEEERQLEREEKRAKTAEKLRKQYDTGQAENDIWTAITDQAKVLDKLGVGYLAGSFLVSCREGKAIVAVPSQDSLGHIKQRFAILIHRMIASRKDWKTVDVEYVMLDE